MPSSRLQRLVANQIAINFPSLDLIENSRPDWCLGEEGERLELDIYLPKIDMAIEVQGAQHYKFTPHFHATPREFEAQQRRDVNKKVACARYGLILIEIDEDNQVPDLLEQISVERAKQLVQLKAMSSLDMARLERRLLKLTKRIKAILGVRNTVPLNNYLSQANPARIEAESIFAEYGVSVLSSVSPQIFGSFWIAYNNLAAQWRKAEKARKNIKIQNAAKQEAEHRAAVKRKAEQKKREERNKQRKLENQIKHQKTEELRSRNGGES